MKKIISLILLLNSCTTTPTPDEVLATHLELNSCDEAVSLIKQNWLGLDFYYRYATIELECRGNQDKAIKILTLAAKYGHSESIALLEALDILPPAINQRPLPPIAI